jgi:hypothetical protein
MLVDIELRGLPLTVNITGPDEGQYEVEAVYVDNGIGLPAAKRWTEVSDVFTEAAHTEIAQLAIEATKF